MSRDLRCPVCEKPATLGVSVREDSYGRPLPYNPSVDHVWAICAGGRRDENHGAAFEAESPPCCTGWVVNDKVPCELHLGHSGRCTTALLAWAARYANGPGLSELRQAVRLLIEHLGGDALPPAAVVRQEEVK